MNMIESIGWALIERKDITASEFFAIFALVFCIGFAAYFGYAVAWNIHMKYRARKREQRRKAAILRAGL